MLATSFVSAYGTYKQYKIINNYLKYTDATLNTANTSRQLTRNAP